MVNILFKRGLLANLPKNSATDGALYFTTDEGGLYLGVDGKAKRIQGVVQQHATINDFKSTVKPPYDTDVIYYISGQNALVKWVSEATAEEPNKGHFEVLNVTAAEFATEVAAREALAGRVTIAEGTIGEHTTAINGINTSINDIVKENGTIDVKIATSAKALTTLINGKADNSTVTQLSNDFNTHKQAFETYKGEQTTIDNGQDQLIEGHTTEIGNIKETLATLMGSGEAGGTIADQIKNAIDANNLVQKATDDGQDDKISQNEEDIKENATNIANLTTELGNYKTTVGNTYATKEELTSHASTAQSTYATKEELAAHASTAQSTYATQTALGEVSGVANEAKGAATTNANNISTLRGEYDAYVISNNKALADVKATADAAATKADFDQEKTDVRKLISDEVTRATGVEGELQTAINGIDGRVADIETWFKAQEDEDGTIESLTELLNYLEAHKGEATDMAADIQKNAEDIEDIKDEIGVPSGENVEASGLHARIETLESGLATEITNRTEGDNDTLEAAKAYTDAGLTWGDF